MSTAWPAPPPPYQRRSRSRSPYRGGTHPPRPPYPEVGYGDAYRADWDAYDRDRSWAGYERDRPGYDLARRGRSRSPGMDENGRKRRRSLSPYDSRHEPRPRYDDYEHGRYGRSPPRGSYPYGGRNGPPDPNTFEYPASLKQYAEWFRFYYPTLAAEEDLADKAAEQEAGDGTKPRNGIRMKWEQYKKDFAAMQLSRMFDHHRKSPWFAEKYGLESEYVNLRARTRQRGWRGRLPDFLRGLEEGLFDPELEQVSDISGESASKDEQAVNGDANGEDSKPTADGDDQFEEDNGPDTNGKGGADLAAGDAKKVNRGEEVTVPNEGQQVMIRTIPPDIGRAKLESALSSLPGYAYVALGDPLQKRNFYRAGWIKFEDGTDMEGTLAQISEKKIEGFKLHVTHLVKPFSNRIRYAPEVASRPERLEIDLANAKTLANLLESEYNTYRTTRYPPPSAAAKPEGTEANGDVPKPDAEDVKMEETEPTSPVEEEPEPSEAPSDAITRRLEKLLVELKESGSVDPSDERIWSMQKTALELDMYLAYLRSAFHTCYYCAVVTDHLEELQRKCIKHMRKPLTKRMLEEIRAADEAAATVAGADAKAEDNASVKDEDGGEDKPLAEKATSKEKPSEGRDWKRNDERWLEWLDSKVALLINRDGVNPKDYGGKSYDEELAKAVEPHIKQEDEGKFRCKTCQKLFKATSFVEKHVVNKHPELITTLDDLPYFNNFALDPHRIQPFTHPPNAPTTGQPPAAAAYGMHAAAPYGADYARGGHYGAPYGYPPAYPYGAYPMDPYAYPYPPPGGYGGRDPRGRLGDRIGGYAPGYDGPAEPAAGLPIGAGLPAKPVATLEPGPGPRRGGRAPGGPPPPPPPDAKEDPRAAAGRRVSYHDMDLVAEGDVELQY